MHPRGPGFSGLEYFYAQRHLTYLAGVGQEDFMSEEVVAALVGAGVGGVIAALVAVLLHVLQRKDADEDWRKSNQRDIDWKVEEFVIDVHDFYRDPQIEWKKESTDMFGKLAIHTFNSYDQDRGSLLYTRAEAYQDRVTDPILMDCLRVIRLELRKANHDMRFVDGKEAPIHDSCKRFYRRIAEMYGDPSKVSTPEQDDEESKAQMEEKASIVAVEHPEESPGTPEAE